MSHRRPEVTNICLSLQAAATQNLTEPAWGDGAENSAKGALPGSVRNVMWACVCSRGTATGSTTKIFESAAREEQLPCVVKKRLYIVLFLWPVYALQVYCKFTNVIVNSFLLFKFLI